VQTYYTADHFNNTKIIYLLFEYVRKLSEEHTFKFVRHFLLENRHPLM